MESAKRKKPYQDLISNTNSNKSFDNLIIKDNFQQQVTDLKNKIPNLEQNNVAYLQKNTQNSPAYSGRVSQGPKSVKNEGKNMSNLDIFAKQIITEKNNPNIDNQVYFEPNGLITQSIQISLQDNSFNKKNSIQNFKLGKKLGSGKFSDVYSAVDKQTGFRVAIKQIKKSTIIEYKLTQDILNEIKTQYMLSHPNIVSLYGYFYENDSLYLIQELACGCELFADLKQQPYKRYNETKASLYVRQVIEGLLYMHARGIVHRDIKPENIILNNGILKICDFGYATFVEKDKMRQTFCGTLDYVSPEMVEGKQYDFSVDIWSVGILVYELIFGNAPFTGKNHDATFDKVVKGDLKFSGPISFEGVDFIKKILVKDPNKRMDLNTAYQHPFIQNNTAQRQETFNYLDKNDQIILKKK
ncbi:protein kinase domain protein [Ichthyophthirius multifiliis]|uniref:Aurora kinase n=1 Tax=Ichthyophthirius multifiliis TaxID=5932 RepID=G0R239_ICHMU|nr:protein kinase domain protein [Ichthyophthirius multifiliis]EGR28467.1 protein kinase domain protein [Ichthyophthirius multifiliis]|eukprot:XP_004029703.1 protein kinase domain protein [Ichthyophthirius multifiliis]